MHVFIDESGQPHPNDQSTRPVVVAVCIDREASRSITAQIYALKRRLGTPDIELKGVNLLNRRVFHRRANEWELAESFFDLCRSLPFTVFAIIMERPKELPLGTQPGAEAYLPNQYRFLLQRVNQFALERGKLATLLFDGDGPTLFGGLLPDKFESFLYRSEEGRSFSAISDAPFFVDSRLTQGIQIADMVASVIRHFQEAELYRHFPVGDGFLSAVARYYNTVREKTQDLTSFEGWPRPGFYFMPERDHYRGAREMENQEAGDDFQQEVNK